jgi:hypothetical protein
MHTHFYPHQELFCHVGSHVGGLVILMLGLCLCLSGLELFYAEMLGCAVADEKRNVPREVAAAKELQQHGARPYEWPAKTQGICKRLEVWSSRRSSGAPSHPDRDLCAFWHLWRYLWAGSLVLNTNTSGYSDQPSYIWLLSATMEINRPWALVGLTWHYNLGPRQHPPWAVSQRTFFSQRKKEDPDHTY